MKINVSLINFFNVFPEEKENAFPPENLFYKYLKDRFLNENEKSSF